MKLIQGKTLIFVDGERFDQCRYVLLVDPLRNEGAYDMEELEFTNNPMEQLFHRSKHHFKALLGRDNVSSAFLSHGALHVQLLDVDFSKKNVSDVLLACETPLIEANRRELNAQYATVKRTWRIRDIDTGNIARFEDYIRQLESP
ncbi:hypothetical protein LCGC14_1673960 [marine sediment metagenome]|uniref:Uncharacterized protein n=1 Tax=marine sediment metagenome TaxID=412755 RepID=A0A0F9ICZ7_9ZZZZ